MEKLMDKVEAERYDRVLEKLDDPAYGIEHHAYNARNAWELSVAWVDAALGWEEMRLAQRYQHQAAFHYRRVREIMGIE